MTKKEVNQTGTNKEEIMEKLMIKEAELTKTMQEIKAYEKKVNQLKNSNTGKLSHIWGRTRTKGQRKDQYIKQLEQTVNKLEQELVLKERQLDEALLDTNTFNSGQITKMIRRLKEDAQLIQFINHLVEAKTKHENNYNEALIYAARTFMKDKKDYRNYIYSKVMNGLKIEEMPEFLLRPGLNNEIELKNIISFRACLHARIRKMQLSGQLPEYVLDDKRGAYAFVDELGVKRPSVSEVYTQKDLPIKEGVVIKPENGEGSKGVYLVYQEDDIFDVKRSLALNSLESLYANMKEDIRSGFVRSDAWVVEELIFENRKKKIPARDIKFYCFYGKVGLILEIIRYPERKYCWWTSTGERIDTGKYGDELFKGEGVTKEELEVAKRISLEIPTPFIRIDFLRGEDGLVFGEFTPKPGNYDEFDNETDYWLGDMFIEAEERIMHDLLSGKKFTKFMEYKRKMEKQ